VPAAAVIPAPIAYAKVVAVKRPVVGSRESDLQTPGGVYRSYSLIAFPGSLP
jgi:hypothetical protein